MLCYCLSVIILKTLYDIFLVIKDYLRSVCTENNVIRFNIIKILTFEKKKYTYKKYFRHILLEFTWQINTQRQRESWHTLKSVALEKRRNCYLKVVVSKARYINPTEF